MCAQYHHLVPMSPPLSEEQRRWLRTGLGQPGGKLPRHTDAGECVAPALVQACLAAGLVEPWARNPVLGDEDIRVCRLTEAGRVALASESVIRVDFTQWKRDTSVSHPVSRRLVDTRCGRGLVSAAAGLRIQEDLPQGR